MVAAESPAIQTYRIVLLAHGSDGVFVVPSSSGFCLPAITTLRHARPTQQLTRNIERLSGRQVVCLFETKVLPAPNERPDVRYQVMEFVETFRNAPNGFSLLTLPELDGSSFCDSQDWLAVHASLKQCCSATSGSGLFAKPGWFRELNKWAGDALAPHGLRLTGKFSQFSATPTSSLVRFETNAAPVWLKAVGTAHPHEFAITLHLARRLPQYTPTVIATHEKFNAWLALEADGTSLGPSSPVQHWLAASTALATLQCNSIQAATSLRSLVQHDLRLSTLTEIIDPLLDEVSESMLQQENAPPARLNHQQLTDLADRLQSAIREMELLGLPDSLGHLDLNPGNIIVSDSRCTFLDWAEAYVGPAFLSLSYLLEYFSRMPLCSNFYLQCLSRAYQKVWNAQVPPAKVLHALKLSPLVAAFAYAASFASWKDRNALSHSPEKAKFLRSLARRMFRESQFIQSGRHKCP